MKSRYQIPSIVAAMPSVNVRISLKLTVPSAMPTITSGNAVTSARSVGVDENVG
ncbi:MAG: hypothetical protein ABSG81_00925 [Acidimicrobiales bacterium]